MYAVIRDAGRIVVYAPYDTPVVAPNDGAATVTVCPPVAADHTTGTLAHPYQYAARPALAAVPVRAPATASVTDLNTPTIAGRGHPHSHRRFVVGPFTGPDRAEQRRHAPVNRFAENGANRHVLALTAPTTTGTATRTSGVDA
ncbi:hypothetical protein [Micromonospora craniellae]|uniref:Uncharacterized protein n=1 Tax=Micromonospora craniellae TaxID=2294034 RepID=A0A372FR71_9ACTN|nr:hypothetical protein [Micromonospora craniellae]QOC92237.1 hypothetical protein ID554_31135 [Micromonospora craniellae]RFS40982.1 hypothetical protein D0Q02_29935 [Micromonospora craniellae]